MSLPPLIENNRPMLQQLCARYHVRRLDLFGSARRDRFDLESSDLDFLVEFRDLDLTQYADAYFGLLEALQDLFGRPVDLVMLSAVKNPYFLQQIERTRTMLYAA